MLNRPKLYAVLTTIQPPTPAVRGLCRSLRRVGGRLLVLGDRKGPRNYPLAGAELFGLEGQLALPLRLPRLLQREQLASLRLILAKETWPHSSSYATGSSGRELGGGAGDGEIRGPDPDA